MLVQYKCPNCGADMAFDSATGTLRCESCGREDHIENMPNSQENLDALLKNPVETEGNYSANYPEGYIPMFGDDAVVQYNCNSCGAALMAEANTTATSCSFCGANMILGDRLQGSYMPAKVIPFKINKQEAQAAFKKWCKKGILTPAAFRKADRVKTVTGIYVPFWLYDLKGNGDMLAHCTKVRHYRMGKYDCTETKHYDVYRSANLRYLGLPADGSKKMNDQLMDKLEPFNYNELVSFNMPYLAGYIAEKYDVTDEELFPRVQKRASDFVEAYMRASIKGYTSVTCTRKNINISGLRRADYTLLPIWMVCYDYKDSEHVFAMNGQTGKIVGKPPISKGRAAAWFFGISAVSFGILELISLLVGGAL